MKMHKDTDGHRRTGTDGQRDRRTEQRELSRQAKRDSKKHAQLSSVCRSQGRISVCVCVSVCTACFYCTGCCVSYEICGLQIGLASPCPALPRLSLPRVDTDAFYFWPALPAGLINSVFAASLTVLRPTNSKLAGKLLDTKGSRGRGYVHGTLQGKGNAKHLDCKLCCSRMSLTSPISCNNFLQQIHLTAVYTL